jgi:hypothetical protein
VEPDPYFFPIYIDINDFQAVMPPLIEIPPYTEAEFERILERLKRGVFQTSIFPSGLIQAHLPFIKKEDVIGIFDVFPIE